MPVKTLKTVVDLEQMSIGDALVLDTLSKKAADGTRIKTDASFSKVVEILDRTVKVEGFETVTLLPITALTQLMDAIMSEIEKMGSPTTGPSTTSDSGS